MTSPNRGWVQEYVLRRLPELASYPIEQKQDWWDAADRACALGRRSKVLITVYWAVVVTAFTVWEAVIGRWLMRGATGHWIGAAGALAMFVGGLWVDVKLRISAVRRQLWTMLPNRCPHCGYDLTANASGVCPECGRAVERSAGGKVE